MSRGLKVLVDPAFPDHRKVRALGRALKIHPMQAMGHVVALWCRVMTECPSGVIRSWSADDIADAAKWEGDAQALVKALRSKPIRFLEATEVHDWTEEQGNVIEKRASWAKERAERRKREKERKEAEERAKNSSGQPSASGADISNVRGGQSSPDLSGADKGGGLAVPSHPIPSRPIPPTGGADADSPPTYLDRCLEASAVWTSPGDSTKAREFQDLERQGIPVDRVVKAFAENPKADFYAVLRPVRNGKAHVQFKPSPPREARACKNPRCESGKVIDHEKTTGGGTTVYKSCPDCSTKGAKA